MRMVGGGIWSKIKCMRYLGGGGGSGDRKEFEKLQAADHRDYGMPCCMRLLLLQITARNQRNLNWEMIR